MLIIKITATGIPNTWQLSVSLITEISNNDQDSNPTVKTNNMTFSAAYYIKRFLIFEIGYFFLLKYIDLLALAFLLTDVRYDLFKINMEKLHRGIHTRVRPYVRKPLLCTQSYAFKQTYIY